MGLRRVLRATALAAFLGIVLVPGGPLAAESSDLLGTARDTLGHAVAGVHVLVLSERATGGAVAEAYTGTDGRYAIAGLAPGIYRIAAVKEGYRAFLGQVHTLFRDSLDLVLEPLPGDPALTPEDLNWVLRLPPRSILREIESGLPGDPAAARGGADALRASAGDVLQGHVEHLVSLPSSATPGRSGEGSETRVSLGGRVGERTAVSFTGGRTALEPVPLERRDVEDVSLAVSYEAGRDARLDVTAFYAGRTRVSDFGDDLGQAREDRTTRGLDARWTSQIDAASEVAVQVAYLDATWSDGFLPGPAGPADRALGAWGSYRALVGGAHDVSVDLRARGRDGRLLDSPMGGPGAWVAASDADGRVWDVRLDVGDSWAASGPWSVVYGVGYARDLRTGGGTGRLVGRAGASWTDGSARGTLVLSLADGPGWDAGASGARAGYHALLEVPVGGGVRLTAEQLDEPLHASDGDREDGMLPVIADGALALRRSRIGLAREQGPARTWVELARGEATGRVSPVLPLDLPVVILAQGTLAYTSGALGVRVVPSGTDVSAEYVRLEGAGLEVSQGWLELRLAQEILRTAGAGARWRLLLAARTVSGPEAPEDPAAREIDPWIRAGVSLAF